MKCKDQAGWDLTVKNNSDPCGKGAVDFARRWAEMMERRIEAGEALDAIAEQCANDSDTGGITGFVYGCAVSVLSKVWEHGEDLRRWHNLDMQIGNEGEQANASGLVLNPALMTINVKGGA